MDEPNPGRLLLIFVKLWRRICNISCVCFFSTFVFKEFIRNLFIRIHKNLFGGKLSRWVLLLKEVTHILLMQALTLKLSNEGLTSWINVFKDTRYLRPYTSIAPGLNFLKIFLTLFTTVATYLAESSWIHTGELCFEFCNLHSVANRQNWRSRWTQNNQENRRHILVHYNGILRHALYLCVI